MGLNGSLLQKGVSPKFLVFVGFMAVIGYEVITYFLATPASGLSNMLRLLGGAIGIAVTNTFVIRCFAIHLADLIGNVSL
jgi:MFS transporter, DHA2 family, multidrug resistance protein